MPLGQLRGALPPEPVGSQRSLLLLNLTLDPSLSLNMAPPKSGGGLISITGVLGLAA